MLFLVWQITECKNISQALAYILNLNDSHFWLLRYQIFGLEVLEWKKKIVSAKVSQSANNQIGFFKILWAILKLYIGK